MKKTTVVFLLLCIGSTLKGVTPDEVDAKIREIALHNYHEPLDRPFVTEEMKRLIIDKLSLRPISDNPSESTLAENVMTAIGHIPVVKAQVAELMKGNRPHAIEFYATEETLFYLIDGLRNGSSTVNMNAHVIHASIRGQFAHRMIGIIRGSSFFPEAAKEWTRYVSATLFLGGPEADEPIHQLSEWWEHNKEAILEKRYADATWLPDYKTSPAYVKYEENNRRGAEKRKKRDTERAAIEKEKAEAAEQKAPRSPLPPPSPATGLPQKTEPVRSWNHWWTAAIAAGAIVIASILRFLWRKERSGN